jgi:hypothetical protein
MSYIVKTEQFIYLAKGPSGNYETFERRQARRYSRWQDAKCALTWWQKYFYRPLAEIIKERER